MEAKFKPHPVSALRGYTLVEALVAVSIWSLLLAGIFPAVYDYWLHSSKAAAMADGQRDVEKALRTIGLSAAYALDITVNNTTITITTATGQDVYEYSNGILYRTPPGGTKYVLARNLNGFSASFTGLLEVHLQFGGRDFAAIISPR